MGPGGLNFRVRDGNGCDPSGMIAGNLEKQVSGAGYQVPEGMELVSLTPDT